MRERKQPDPEKLRALQKALEEYSGAEPLVDENREKPSPASANVHSSF